MGVITSVIKDLDEYHRILKKHTLVIVLFTSPYCQACLGLGHASTALPNGTPTASKACCWTPAKPRESTAWTEPLPWWCTKMPLR